MADDGWLQVKRALNSEWYDDDGGDPPTAESWFVVGRCFLEIGRSEFMRYPEWAENAGRARGKRKVATGVLEERVRDAIANVYERAAKENGPDVRRGRLSMLSEG